MRRFAKYLIIFWSAFILLVFIMGVTRSVFLNGRTIQGTPKQVVIFLSSFIYNVARFSDYTKPQAVKSSSLLEKGFNMSQNFKGSKDYILISYWNDSLNQSAVKLVRISDGKVLHMWAPDIDRLIEAYNLTPFASIVKLNRGATILRHPVLTNDGSLIFTAGSIHKIDKNSNIVWSKTYPYHHSIEQDSDGNILVCSYNRSTINSDKYQMFDDAIQKISLDNGEIIYEKSVFDILMENGYGRGVFFINPMVTAELSNLDYVHLNDIEPVLEDSRYWKKGDLFLSLRNQNLVLLYRPSTNKIIWSQNGPWLRQHDVDIIDSSRISIFGNDVINTRFDNQREGLIEGHNNLYIFDFSNNQLTTPYEMLFHSTEIVTSTSGMARVLSNGDIFIEESNHGRMIYGNHNEEIWSYLERIDDKKVSTLNWCRYITEEEFKKLTFINIKSN